MAQRTSSRKTLWKRRTPLLIVVMGAIFGGSGVLADVGKPPGGEKAPSSEALHAAANLPANLPQIYKRWIAELSHQDVTVRRRAVTSLGLGGPDASWALPQLYAALINDDDVGVRKLAAVALGRQGPRGVAVVPGLVEILGDEDEPVEVRLACTQALGNIGAGAQAAIPVLTRVVANSSVQHAATGALVRLGAKGQAALAAMLKKADGATQAQVLAAVGELGPEAKDMLPLFVDLAKQGDAKVRQGVLHALARLTVPSADIRQLCLSALLDGDAKVRLAALAGLEGQGAAAAEALKPVRRGLHDPAAEVQAQAALTLGAMGRAGLSAADELADLARRGNTRVRGPAALALALIGADAGRAGPLLAAALADAEPRLRSRLAMRLSLYGPAAKEAVPALVTLIKHRREPESTPVIAAVARIGAPALPGIMTLLDDNDIKVRARALEIVRRMPPQGKALLPLLLDALKEEETLMPAIHALEAQGAAAVPASATIAKLLSRKMPWPLMAVSTLECIGYDANAAPILEKMVRGDVQQRRLAARAVAGNGPGAEELLKRLMQDSDSQVRLYARTAATHIKEKATFPAAREALRSGDPAARLKAAYLLLHDRPPDSTAALIVLGAVRDPREGRRAMLELAGRTPKDWEFLNALVALINDADSEIRLWSRRILKDMDRDLAGELNADAPPAPLPRPTNAPPPANYASLPMPARKRLRLPDESVQCAFRYLVPKGDTAKGARSVLVAERASEPGPVRAGGFRGILARELIRQAVLLAAREEIGVLTRDLSLRETFTDAAAFDVKAEFTLAIRFKDGTNVRVLILPPSGSKEPLWQRDLAVTTTHPFDYLKLAEEMERCARTDWPAVLRRVGVEASSRRAPGTAPLPATVETRLNKMTYAVQIAALRDLDRARRSEGDSPTLIAGLVRAYANLGVLTNFHYSAAYKAYMARALLYAQRLIAAAPKAAFARWQRAYAAALAGLPAAALADLSEAARLEKNGAFVVPARPEWVSVIDAYCRHDTAALEHPNASELARLLGFLDVVNPRTKALSVGAGRRILQVNPECYCVRDELSNLGGVSLLHETTGQDPAELAQSLAKLLRTMPDLPPDIAAELAPPADKLDEIKLLRLLEAAGALTQDAVEPPWSSLAWLVRDTRLKQLLRRVDFLRGPLAVPREMVVQFIHDSLPLLQDHPYGPMLRLHEKRDEKQIAAMDSLRKSLDASELTPRFESHFTVFANRTNEEAANQRGSRLAEQHADDIQPDLGFELRHLWGKEKPPRARLLLKISPGNPIARTVLLVGDWDSVKDEVAHWDQPLVLAELWRRYAGDKKFKDAERVLKRYLTKSPDFWAYDTLAGIYKLQDRLDLWEETMEEFLKQEDLGLEHAQTQAKLSRHYMERKEWKKALPHAEGAAGSGAGWAMLNLGTCYTGLREWAKAEAVYRAVAQRYPDGGLNWFKWCATTGRGDLPMAVKAGLEAWRRSGRGSDPLLLALDDLIHKHPQQALERVQGIRTKEPIVHLLVFVLADEVGKQEVRDAAVKRIAPDHYLGSVASLFAKAGPKGKLDLKAAEELLAKQKKEELGTSAFFIGRFLDLHGQPDAALAFYVHCIANQAGSSYARALACTYFRAHGHEPRGDETRLAK